MIHTIEWLVLALVLSGGLMLMMRMVLRRKPQRTQRNGSQRSKSRPPQTLQIPETWPFNPRRIVGSAEREIWQWLCKVFPEHEVLVKLPFTRFVTPFHPEDARAWFQVLSNVYCTFAICTGDGRVIGCMDVVTPAGLPRGNRQIKQTLLAQCGIGYWAVENGRPPSADSLRSGFLRQQPGRDPDTEPPLSEAQRLEEVRIRLNQTLDRNRKRLQQETSLGQLENLPSDMAPLSDAPPRHAPHLSPIASRRAGLDAI